LIPVIPNGGNLNQCQDIIDWARFCPAQGNNTADAFPSQGALKGTVTCGQSPWTSRDTQCYSQRLIRDKTSGMSGCVSLRFRRDVDRSLRATIQLKSRRSERACWR
jgi:hypothetical protein